MDKQQRVDLLREKQQRLNEIGSSPKSAEHDIERAKSELSQVLNKLRDTANEQSQ